MNNNPFDFESAIEFCMAMIVFSAICVVSYSIGKFVIAAVM
jgi:hypothetical protein